MSAKIQQPLLVMVPKVQPKAKTKLKLRFQTFRCTRKTVSKDWHYEFVQEFYHLDDALKSHMKLEEECKNAIHPDLCKCGLYDTESKMWLERPKAQLIESIDVK